MCHMSGVRCQVSDVFIFIYIYFFWGGGGGGGVDKVVKLVTGGSVINGAYPV